MSIAIRLAGADAGGVDLNVNARVLRVLLVGTIVPPNFSKLPFAQLTIMWRTLNWISEWAASICQDIVLSPNQLLVFLFSS